MDPMGAKKELTDQEIMSRLREPIGKLVEKYCAEKTEYQKLRLRQLAWQAVDVLVRTGKIAHLETEKDIKRITRSIRELGASEKFIQESLSLAASIYKQMQIYYPGLLRRYGSRG
jgi:hypothetical protein